MQKYFLTHTFGISYFSRQLSKTSTHNRPTPLSSLIVNVHLQLNNSSTGQLLKWMTMDLLHFNGFTHNTAPQEDKVVQMYETMMTRHSTMIVGPTGGGKTVVINTLIKAQCHMGLPTKCTVLNPKVSLPLPAYLLSLVSSRKIQHWSDEQLKQKQEQQSISRVFNLIKVIKNTTTHKMLNKKNATPTTRAQRICNSLLLLAGNCLLASMAFVPLLLIPLTSQPTSQGTTVQQAHHQPNNGQPTLTRLQQLRGMLLRHLPSHYKQHGLCHLSGWLPFMLAQITPPLLLLPHTHTRIHSECSCCTLLFFLLLLGAGR